MSLPPRTERPAFVIVAGPNGSGKSTAYRDTIIELDDRTIWIVNPDLLTERIQETEHLDLRPANIAAVTRIEAWAEASIDVHKTVGVETVLSTDKYRRLVTKAKELGFEIWLFYVVLDSVELNVERVKLRVRKGGHFVSEEDVRKRYPRSLAQFSWFLNEADRAWIYDNSGATLKQIGEKADGEIRLEGDAPAAVIEAVRLIETP